MTNKLNKKKKRRWLAYAPFELRNNVSYPFFSGDKPLTIQDVSATIRATRLRMGTGCKYGKPTIDITWQIKNRLNYGRY